MIDRRQINLWRTRESFAVTVEHLNGQELERFVLVGDKPLPSRLVHQRASWPRDR